MVQISKDGNAIKFTFTDSQHYLYNDGIIECPVNSLALVTDDSQMAVFRKAASNDIFVSATYAELGMSKDDLISWFKENAVGSTGGGGGGEGISSAQCQTMIDESISGKADSSAVTAEISAAVSGCAEATAVTEEISEALEDVYTKDEVDAGFSSVTSSVTAINSSLTAHTADTGIHTTTAEKEVWNGKQDALTAGSGISITNNVISVTASTGGSNVVELTQAQYNALVDKDPDVLYVITDAPEINISGYAQSSAVTAEIAAAVSGKVDTTAVTTSVTSASTDSQIPTAKAVYDAVGQGGGGVTIATAITSSSTNDEAAGALATYNAITAATTGGGATYSAGTNISIDTANTISCTLPISAGTGQGSIINLAYNNEQALGKASIAWGYNAIARKDESVSIGGNNDVKEIRSLAVGQTVVLEGSWSCGFGVNNHSYGRGNSIFGTDNTTSNWWEAGFGKHNNSVSASTTFGNSGNTLFSVGNGADGNNRHNAFEIRQNGDIYCSNGTSDVKLQDYMQVKVVKISQSDYDALVQGGTVDSNTLYIVSNVVS